MKINTVLIISLKNAFDRRKCCLNECKKMGFENIILIDAIDGKKENMDLHIACTLSHIKAWNYVLENNIDNYIIVEDDVFFCDKNKWINITKNLYLNLDWDILLFGYFGLSEINKNYSFVEKILFKLPLVGNDLYKNPNSKKINNNLFIPESPLGLHCYTINKKSLIKIKKIFNVPYNLPDVMLNLNARNINIYAIAPCLAYQNINKFGSSLSYKTLFEQFFNKFSTGYVPVGWRLSCYGNKILNYPITGFTYIYLILFILIIIIFFIYYHRKQNVQNLV